MTTASLGSPYLLRSPTGRADGRGGIAWDALYCHYDMVGITTASRSGYASWAISKNPKSYLSARGASRFSWAGSQISPVTPEPAVPLLPASPTSDIFCIHHTPRTPSPFAVSDPTTTSRTSASPRPRTSRRNIPATPFPAHRKLFLTGLCRNRSSIVVRSCLSHHRTLTP